MGTSNSGALVLQDPQRASRAQQANIAVLDNLALFLDVVASFMHDLEAALNPFFPFFENSSEFDSDVAVAEVARLAGVLSHVLEAGIKITLVRLPLNVQEPFKSAADKLRRTLFEYEHLLTNERDTQPIVDRLLRQYGTVRQEYWYAARDLRSLLLAPEASRPEDALTPALELADSRSQNAEGTRPGLVGHKNRGGKGKRGGQVKYKAKDDQQVANSWATDGYKRHEELATALNKTVEEVRLALDRVRKRKRKQKTAAE